MAHFRGTVQGSRGEASRLAGPQTGIRTTANGWDEGCNVQIINIDGKDTVRVYRNGGSNGNPHQGLIAWWAEGDPVIHLTKGVEVDHGKSPR